jgi:hypothetical protein
LYLDEPVLMICEVAIAAGALRFQLAVAEGMVVGRHVGESGSHNNSAFWGIRDREAVCVPKRERDSTLAMWIHAAQPLR